MLILLRFISVPLTFMLRFMRLSLITYTCYQYSVSNTTAYASLLAYQLHYCDIIRTCMDLHEASLVAVVEFIEQIDIIAHGPNAWPL